MMSDAKAICRGTAPVVEEEDIMLGKRAGVV
jgi:hypothetical protein